MTSLPVTRNVRFMGKTNQERQQALREKRKRLGWQRVEFYLPPSLVARVRAYVAKLLRGERS